jgi:hypothetical protein
MKAIRVFCYIQITKLGDNIKKGLGKKGLWEDMLATANIIRNKSFQEEPYECNAGKGSDSYKHHCL